MTIILENIRKITPIITPHNAVFRGHAHYYEVSFDKVSFFKDSFHCNNEISYDDAMTILKDNYVPFYEGASEPLTELIFRTSKNDNSTLDEWMSEGIKITSIHLELDKHSRRYPRCSGLGGTSDPSKVGWVAI